MTPFLPPHHRKDAATQLAQSLEALGYPAPAAIELIASPILREAKAVALPGFVPRAAAARRWARLALPESSLACWRIVFAGPVAGPVLLGQFSHFGLGRFVPADWRPLDTSL
jgi:CRISPR-associated protein Csb2